MPYNPYFQQMMLEMLMQQYPQFFGGGGYGGNAGFATGMSPYRGIPSNLGISPFYPPPVQGGYSMMNRPQQGGYNVRRREQPALSYWGRRPLGNRRASATYAGDQAESRKKKGQQETPRYWGLGFTGR